MSKPAQGESFSPFAVVCSLIALASFCVGVGDLAGVWAASDWERGQVLLISAIYAGRISDARMRKLREQ